MKKPDGPATPLLTDCDRKKMADLYVKYQKNIRAYIISLGVKQPVAEDLTQNVFIQICSDYVSDRKIKNLEGYLFGLARYLVHAYRRKAKRLPIILLSADLEKSLAWPPTSQPHQSQICPELVEGIPSQALNRAIADLPEKYREAFELRYTKNLPLSVAAGLAGCSKNTLSQRTRRAIKIIKARLNCT